MLTLSYLLVNAETIALSVDCTYEFTSGTMILYLTYWTYAQMDVIFL